MSFQYLTAPLKPGRVNAGTFLSGDYTIFWWASLKECAEHPRVVVMSPDADLVARADYASDHWVVETHDHEYHLGTYRRVAEVLDCAICELNARLCEARQAKEES